MWIEPVVVNSIEKVEGQLFKCVLADGLDFIVHDIPVPMQVGGKVFPVLEIGLVIVAVIPIVLDVFLFSFPLAILTAIVPTRDSRMLTFAIQIILSTIIATIHVV